jgi:N6-L-threonylcarbamoyladenine synthase
MMSIYILGIESSCDDTAASVFKDDVMLSNLVANQGVHKEFGGVVPELASRAHQQNIIPVIQAALAKAKISKNQLNAVAFTRGPGLLGSLLVGTSFAKSFALALGIPILEVDHLDAHIMAHFIQDRLKTKNVPSFPFLCLTVSGGHSQITKVRGHLEFEMVGQTIDDAAGEAFDKAAKIMGLPYPGGPLIDKLAKDGNPHRFNFPESNIPGFDYSFSGLKTSFLYFVRDNLKEDKDFIEKNKYDLAASIQETIVNSLMKKLKRAADDLDIKDVAIAGGVSANSRLRSALHEAEKAFGWRTFIPEFQYCTDNAAMIAITGYFKYMRGEFAVQNISPYSKSTY